jgi:pseudouridine-5'-phosphate glycosidase
VGSNPTGGTIMINTEEIQSLIDKYRNKMNEDGTGSATIFFLLKDLEECVTNAAQ